MTRNIVVIGAGPAGLTAAYLLSKRKEPPVILEADKIVGGISRTERRDNFCIDIGGHRFFTKVAEVNQLWHEILPSEQEFLLRPRKSRIYYKGKFFDYPLNAPRALKDLGFHEALMCGFSYLWARSKAALNLIDQSSYEGWVQSRFGKRLYETFFKTYTEKVWGVPASELPADWAAQRIKSLNLLKAVLNPLVKGLRKEVVTSLIEEFHYPKFGPGMMWERAAQSSVSMGAKLFLNTPVTKLMRDSNGVYEVMTQQQSGDYQSFPSDVVISSMPLSDLVKKMEPAAPTEVVEAAEALRYRDFMTIALVVPREVAFDDTWIYVHYPEVRVGRIQNYVSWSPFMAPEGKTCLGLEYFVFKNDNLWNKKDDDLIKMATEELVTIGLIPPGSVEKGWVIRQTRAYPMYDEFYRENVKIIRAWLESEVPNVYPVGRNGMHRYNNQDHSMYTAMLTVENLNGASFDIWAVNVEEEYHEEVSSEQGTGRLAPILSSERI